MIKVNKKRRTNWQQSKTHKTINNNQNVQCSSFRLSNFHTENDHNRRCQSESFNGSTDTRRQPKRTGTLLIKCVIFYLLVNAALPYFILIRVSHNCFVWRVVSMCLDVYCLHLKFIDTSIFGQLNCCKMSTIWCIERLTRWNGNLITFNTDCPFVRV